MAEDGWSELPFDILASIMELLTTGDRARFRSVCTSWNTAPPPLHPPSETPCLLFSPRCSVDGEQKDIRSKLDLLRPRPQQRLLYSISDDRAYKLSGHQADVMADCCSIVYCSPDGWLMYMDKVCELQCVHLPTGERLQPPSITTVPVVTGVETDTQGRITGYYKGEGIYEGDIDLHLCHELHWFYHRGIILFPGSPPDYMPTTECNPLSNAGKTHEYVIVVALDCDGRLAYARQGDTCWTVPQYAEAPTYDIRNLILHRGSLYTVDINGRYVSPIEVNSDLSFGSAKTFPSNFSFLSPRSNQLPASTSYLVDIDGHLCLIWRHVKIIHPELEREPEEADDVEEDDNGNYKIDLDCNSSHGVHFDDVPDTLKTLSFQVFKFDESQATWVEKDTIGGYALFVGNNYSLALSTEEFPHLASDCIYFTDDDYEAYGRPTWWDLGVYNLQDQSVNPYYKGLISMGLPQPTWVMLPAFFDVKL